MPSGTRVNQAAEASSMQAAGDHVGIAGAGRRAAAFDSPENPRPHSLSAETSSMAGTERSYANSRRRATKSASAVARPELKAAQGAEQGETQLGTALKLITSGLGSGVLVVPWGAAGASLFVSHVITAIVLLVNAWTVMIIVHAVDRWGGTRVWDPTKQRWLGTRRQRGYRVDDLGQLLRQAPGPLPAFAVLWDVTVNVSNFGVLVGYMIVVGDTMAPLLASHCPDLADRNTWIMLGSLVCLPLCRADLGFLTYSSAVGVFANLYLFGALFRSYMGVLVPEPGLCLFGVSPGLLACTSNLVFSVVVQMCIPEYYTQLRRDDQEPSKFLRGVVVPSFLFIFVLFCSFSSVGYLAFGPSVNSNVLLEIPQDWIGRSTQIAMCVACIMVYPNMLRPMIRPLMRFATFLWNVGLDAFSYYVQGNRTAVEIDEPGAEEDEVEDVYEGRLVHTELMAPIEVDVATGEATLEVLDTCGFERDALVFVDGAAREWAIVKEVQAFAENDALGSRCAGAGRLILRPRYGAAAQRPIMLPDGRPACALADVSAPPGTKVVLDEDPVLVTGAVAGEKCLHMSCTNGICAGATIVVGEGARAERHRVEGKAALRPELESVQAHIRSHDLVLHLVGELTHHHGAHTRVVLDNGPTDTAASMVVLAVMLVAFCIDSLGVVNVVNGALSVAVIIGIVPGLCALQLREHWHEPLACLNSLSVPSLPPRPMPASIRSRTASIALLVVSVFVGFGSMWFLQNDAASLSDKCLWSFT
eukprot:TRINITY_DN18966_c0_g1_i2.p1 TRINITY_DN18966_c0_g1~~TRINITY_DN18966_c0_g1_i2.p1  ORF type:complete len:757 (+),score=144.14 TRINITY_DN18966_c0_g1_i2:113-2383(+)